MSIRSVEKKLSKATLEEFEVIVAPLPVNLRRLMRMRIQQAKSWRAIGAALEMSHETARLAYYGALATLAK